MSIVDSNEVGMPGVKPVQKRLGAMLLHIGSWLVFLSLPAVFNPRRHGYSIGGFIDDLMEQPRWTNALLLLAVFYTNYYFTIPKLYVQRRYVLFGCTLIGWFAVFFLLNYHSGPPHFMHGPPPDVMGPPPGMMPGRGPGGFNALGNSFNLFMFICVYAFSFALCLYEQWQSTKERMMTAEIAFLKAQINPHFLFNILNNIYALALTKSDSAPDAILKLSGMMRYAVSDGNSNFVSLSKELDYINDYIALQKLRLTDEVKISFELSGEPNGRQIAPFMLIPFVENAFKHGVNSEENSDIRIRILMTDNVLTLEVVNNKVYSIQDKSTGAGLGIGTTRKRLQLLYPGRHTLVIKDAATDYTVSLQMHLT